MARIAGIDLPREKRIEIALTYIYGIGLPTAQKILAQSGVDPSTRVKNLSEDVYKRQALQKLSVIAMGITPYINASIIMQLMTVVLPQLEEMAKKGGEEGRKKISQYTRWLTIVLAVVQATTMSINMQRSGVFYDKMCIRDR